MYKVYLQKEEKHLTRDGRTGDVKSQRDSDYTFPTKQEAERSLRRHLDRKSERDRDRERPLIYSDTMVPELKNGLERYYKGKIEMSQDTPSGFAAVIKDNKTGRYGVAFVNMDTQDVFSKGGFQRKRTAVDLTDEIKDRDIKFNDPNRLRFDKPDFNMKQLETREKVVHIEGLNRGFDR
ncbi:hypothetical protein [Fictibacillus sp. NRS-1165]|uniref:hypothetical protein n=1 Tax=Fictibacillus sp. NRS-1165 TaxID=3144463 RepID=UPI003D2113A9